MHPVMFGEYVPLAKTFPWIYSLTPLHAGIESGVNTPTFPAGKSRVAANICYESVLSHVIRAQVSEQRARGEEPDVLVNLTNDGWFRGSSELDLHLVCGVFRAVECRKPFLVAANTGFSAWIDSSGRVVKKAGRRTTGWIVADVELDDRRSPYLAYGDVPAGTCLIACIGLAGFGFVRRGSQGEVRPKPVAGGDS
jgi:apolipoprotein N-acyltransferase